MVTGLEDYGFEKVGSWFLYPNVKSGIAFDLTDEIKTKTAVIYAFVVDPKVKYIGICPVTALSKRLAEYKGGTTENEKSLAMKIKTCLDEGKKVAIFAFNPCLALKFKDLNVDCVRGLEYPLIAKFDPAWNKSKK